MKSAANSVQHALDPRTQSIRKPLSAIGNPQEACPRSDDGESAAKYLFKLSHDVILSLDRTGNILCINHRGVQLSGYSETELRGANVFEFLLVPEDRPVVREVLANLLQGIARQYEVRWRTKNGVIIH